MFFTRFIPAHIIATLYTRGSLLHTAQGLQFSLKNRLVDAVLTKVESVKVNEDHIPLDAILVNTGAGKSVSPAEVSVNTPVDFPLRQILVVDLPKASLPGEKLKVEVIFEVKPFGRLTLVFEDRVQEEVPKQTAVKIPRSEAGDYDEDIILSRRRFAEEYAGTTLDKVGAYAIEAASVKGNCEQFIGTAQVPIGLAGPIEIRGEWANGAFLIPLATTEGSLVASYNRGIKVINRCGGITTTVVDDVMQRAPVFSFSSARIANSFKCWVEDHFAEIQEVAGASSQYARLQRIESFLSNNFAFLRFNFRTGDAAGQNMVTKATYEGCLWMMERCPYKPNHFFLESNMATDKKPSFINSLLSRGKRVTAEITFKKEVLEEELRVTASQLDYHRAVANIGALLAGTNNNGLHSVNAITALFIATGQDVANVAESSACLTHAEVLPNGDLFASLTLPSLIVASYGGGTGLATQRECLELMGCYGEGKAKKLAEIVAGVVAAGEISLAAAISSADWVSSHEALGRNR